MRRLFDALGIDYDQWKALTVVALKNDFRARRARSAHGSRAVRVVVLTDLSGVFYTFFGSMIAYRGVGQPRSVARRNDRLDLHRMFMVGTAVVLDHHSVISSPDGLRGSRLPAGVVAHILRCQADEHPRLHDGADDVAAWVPLLVALVRHGWGISAALLLDIYASSTATTLAIALGYATVLRAVGPDAIERVLSYVQMIMSFAVYGGQFLISGILSQSRPGNWAMPETLWLLI